MMEQGAGSAVLDAGVVCTACRQPITGEYLKANGQPLCQNCSRQVHETLQKNRFAFGPWIMGGVLGFLAAIACGFVWALIVKVSNYELGIIAMLVGVVVAQAVIYGAGQRRGRSIQVLSVLLSVLGIVAGKGLIASWAMWNQVRAGIGETDSPDWFIRLFLFFTAFIFGFSPMDLLWYGIAIYEAWVIPKAPELSIAGPFQATADAPIRFDQAQPVQDVRSARS